MDVAPANVGGIGPAVVGTLEITALATVIAVPLGILGAIYLNEYGGNGPLARLIAFMADVMTGVPSIVMGLFIFSIWMLHFGFSGLAGALALACLMLPIVIRSTHEMLKLVPDPLREASYALGATKARVTMTVVLPAAIGGIVSGALLAVARAAGETAPLLFTILTVTTVNKNVFSGANTSLPSQIFSNATSPYVGAQARGWGAALTLIVIAFILMVVARTRHRTIHPILALGMPEQIRHARKVMEQSEQNVAAKTELPAPAALQDTQQRHAAARYAGRADLRCEERLELLRLLPGRHRRLAVHLRARDHRVHRPVRVRQDDRAADAEPHERPGAGRSRRR